MRKALSTGTQFQHNEAHAWTDADGRKRFHSIVTICEVTSADESGIRYVVRVVREEINRPEGGMVPTPGKSKGALTADGVAAAIKRGSIRPLSADHLLGGN